MIIKVFKILNLTFDQRNLSVDFKVVSGVAPSKELENELKDHVSKEIGPIAKPESISFVESRPKTRSGKIMRRVLKAKVFNQEAGNLRTLDG